MTIFENDNFQQFVKLMIIEYKRLNDLFSSDQIQWFKDKEVIFEPDALREFGYTIEKDEIILESLMQSPIEEARIELNLNSKYFSFKIGELFYLLLESSFPKYLKSPSEIKTILLNHLNEFELFYDNKIIQYETILPLIRIQNRRNKNEPHISEIPLLNEESKINRINEIQTGIKIFSEYVVVRNDKSIVQVSTNIHDAKNNNIIENVGIYAKGLTKFSLNSEGNIKLMKPIIFKSVDENRVWNEIKNLYAAFLIYGAEIKFGTPFYIFPWWISKRLTSRFDFPEPQWMIRKRIPEYPFFTLNLLFEELISRGIVPDLDKHQAFCNQLYPEMVIPSNDTKRNIFTSQTGFHGLGKQQSTRGHTIYSLDDLHIKRIFNILSKESNSINFYRNIFLFDRLIRLSQRRHIEDAIMDACLILESLLTTEKRIELSFRFRLYATLLISSNSTEAKNNYDYFRDLYNLRSIIIHGKENWALSDTYIKFAKNCITFDVNGLDKRTIFEKTNEYIVPNLFSKIVKIVSKIIQINEKFPNYLFNINNIIKLAKNIEE